MVPSNVVLGSLTRSVTAENATAIRDGKEYSATERLIRLPESTLEARPDATDSRIGVRGHGSHIFLTWSRSSASSVLGGCPSPEGIRQRLMLPDRPLGARLC